MLLEQEISSALSHGEDSADAAVAPTPPVPIRVIGKDDMWKFGVLLLPAPATPVAEHEEVPRPKGEDAAAKSLVDEEVLKLGEQVEFEVITLLFALLLLFLEVNDVKKLFPPPVGGLDPKGVVPGL